MKKIFKILGVFFLALLLLIAAVLVHAGLFESVVVTDQETGPYTFVYQDHVGSYYKVGPTMDEVYQSLVRMGIETSRGAGVYYDNPQEVPEDKLRSEVGSLLEEKDLDKVKEIKKTFKVKEIPLQRSVVVKFPIKNKLSYMIAPAKVYKEVNLLWKEQSYLPYEYAIEIYDIPKKTITYIMPIEEIVVDEIIMEEPIVVDDLKLEETVGEATEEATEEVVKEATEEATEETELVVE
jgi:DNA gyrase inhibitor GyrI